MLLESEVAIWVEADDLSEMVVLLVEEVTEAAEEGTENEEAMLKTNSKATGKQR